MDPIKPTNEAFEVRDDEAIKDAESDGIEDVANDHLDISSIERRSKLRRSLYRSRSHAILATILCVVAAAECVRQGIGAYRARATWSSVIFALAAILAILLGLLAYRRAAALHRDCLRPPEPSPPNPPDFSTLSDGSQQWQDLHNVR